LTVKISGIKNNQGNLKLAFYTCASDYKNEVSPKITKIVSKSEVKNGVFMKSFNDIPAGNYGIAVLDDENCNSEMDYSFFIPSEGFGFSNYYHSGMSKPDFNNFCFNFGKEDKTINIKLRYM
jgi:uncharacterized protein (DUF2141 family)